MNTLSLTDIFRKSTSEIEVESRVICPEFSEITYLEDGRSIKQHIERLNTWYGLYTKEGELIRKTENVPTALNEFMARFVPVIDRKGTLILHSGPVQRYILDVETGVDEMMEFDPPNTKCHTYMFGDTTETILAIRRDLKTVLKLKYMRETRKWKVVSEFDIVRKMGGTNIYNSLFDGFDTLFMSIYRSERPPEGQHALCSVNIHTGYCREIFAQSSEINLFMMLTPSVLLISIEDDSSHTLDVPTTTLSMTEMELDDDDHITPDGRYCMERQARSISPDGRHVTQLEQWTDTYAIAEYTLKTPMLHPIMTHRYGEHRWIRLMSDGTVEESKTWPLFGKSLRETVLSDVEPEARLAVIIWASMSSPTSTFEEARMQYLINLTKAIAKEISK